MCTQSTHTMILNLTKKKLLYHRDAISVFFCLNQNFIKEILFIDAIV